MNISQLLNITRPLVVLDTETTGLDVNTARIIELGFQVHYPDKPLLEYRTLIHPGIPIPPESIEVHHITDAMVQACRTCSGHHTAHTPAHDIGEKMCFDFKSWPAFKDLAANLQKGFTNCDFAGKRVTYDLQILVAEFARTGIQWSIGDARIVDADRLEALLNPRHLSDLYEKYARKQCDRCDGSGRITVDIPTYQERCPACSGAGSIGQKLAGAHGALADVEGTRVVIEAQLSAQNGKLAVSLDELHALQFPGMIDLAGKFVFIKGVPCFGRWGKFQGRPMRDADNGYWDFVLRSDFSTEVKRLAAEAKLGRFPEKK